MDDSCAVCAETLEWVAYGSCGHREVCSTCVIRLRFVCDDRRCCLCKSESSMIFITKALGDYTRVINDFSVFPAIAKEGRVGSYWYHEGTQAYCDDLNHYKMIKAMCRLSCSVCDNKIDEQRNEVPKRQVEFKNIDQLNSHLFHRHRLFMCSLCLEGRKIFICEHKLYSRSQLNRHINTGDSEVDGSESERGGFAGHPMCEFCRDPFYGDNELYTHMSTEHFTCHICQRQHPGKYEYYKNYDDLEIHFRQGHFLCEDEACLAKKFIVFTSESEMKRHNAMEHGGNLSRSKRNASLQIPTSFQYRRNNDQNWRGGRNFHPDSPDYQLSLAIQATIERDTAATRPRVASSTESASSSQGRSAIDSIVNPFELLATTDSETSSRHRQSLAPNFENGRLLESFPPLPRASRRSSRTDSRPVGNSMATRLRCRNSVTILNRARPQSASGSVLSSVPSSSSHHKPAGVSEHVGSSHAGSTTAQSATAYGHVSANLVNSSRNSSSIGKPGQSTSASTFGDTGNSISNFPPISAIQTNRLLASNKPLSKAEDVQAANKALIEKIRAALEFDKDKFSSFKEISTKFRKGVSDAGEYLASVHQFGLSHLILELARLCPDAEKQKELLETYNYNVRVGSNGSSSSIDSGQLKNKKDKRKGKEKCEGIGISITKDDLAQHSIHVLPKDGCSSKGKSKVLVDDEQDSANPLHRESSNQNVSSSAEGGSKQSLVSGVGVSKQQRKKSSKFLRARLGETGAAALSDPHHSDTGHVLPAEVKTSGKKVASAGLPVRGVWQNGGGHRLVAMTRRSPPKR